MKNTLRPVLLPLLLASALPLGGCVAVAAGAAAGYGAHKIAANKADREYPADVNRTWNAALAAMREAGYPVGEGIAPHTPNGGYVDVNDARVSVERVSDVTTRVRVRLGTFDTANHRRRADAILDSVGRRVGTVHVVPAPVASPAAPPAAPPVVPPPAPAAPAS